MALVGGFTPLYTHLAACVTVNVYFIHIVYFARGCELWTVFFAEKFSETLLLCKLSLLFHHIVGHYSAAICISVNH